MSQFQDNNPQERSRSPELGISITIEDTGFRLKTETLSLVKNGDVLLVAYKTGASNWSRASVEYQDESQGMFVYTVERPTQVVVLSHSALSSGASHSDVPAVIYNYESGRTSTSCTLDDLLDPFNPISPVNPLDPFTLWDSATPQAFLENLEELEIDERAQDAEAWANTEENRADPFDTETGPDVAGFCDERDTESGSTGLECENENEEEEWASQEESDSSGFCEEVEAATFEEPSAY